MFFKLTMAELHRFPGPVDETLCNHVVCQHPLCWETMRRLERGLPRIKLQSIRKLPPKSEGNLPPLNILKLPQWSADRAIDVSIIPMTSRKTTVSSQSYKSSHPENLQSTSLASSSDFMQFTRSHSSSPATRDRSLNLRKIEVIELQQQSPSCDQYFGKTMFIWVPNLQKKRKWQKKHAQSIMQPQCVSVKEICFQGQPYDELHGLSVEQKQRQKMRKRAKKKTATGGQPYTYFARKQQSLKGRKDIMQPLYEEHRNELPEVAKGILTQPDHSDCVSEQGLMQQYSPAKSQPRLNCCEYQDARKIPGHAMPIPVSKKVPLHHLTEKQRQGQSTWRFRSSWKMDGQSLKTKGLDINNLNLKKCLVNNLSVLQEHISSDQDSVHPPSSVHSTNDECAQPCSDASGMLGRKMAERPEDLNLPNAVITRIIKEALPDGVNISKEARSAISRAASVFVLYATSCANNFAMKSKRKTLSASDVLAAMEEMEFDRFITPLKDALEDTAVRTREKGWTHIQRIKPASEPQHHDTQIQNSTWRAVPHPSDLKLTLRRDKVP
ncbi:DNA polymerase epsilon subunit 3 isoform X6 [Narcine bancroftii]|uniref:DNA polymerase epsilon subunit 3 isoform X6 n=1 Tax=Narcine bancroftii TaxID=1343680 RepID=UPI0038313C6B